MLKFILPIDRGHYSETSVKQLEHPNVDAEGFNKIATESLPY